ncbi:MAG: hypothetical protein HY864_14270 [Chloroflexi bacterium]|nr:hypothetical protein [Chloroflexota bacterium]
MDNKKISTALIALGTLGIIAALLFDVIRKDTFHIQSAQILVIEMGLLTVGLGFLLRQIPVQNNMKGNPLARFLNWLKELPMLTWVLAGFLITYVAFFITPMFFSMPPRIRYFTTYLPDKFPVGTDLEVLINLTQRWFATGQSPFNIQFYPPFTYIFLSPLLLAGGHLSIFRLVTIITIISFILSSLIIPLLMTRRGDKSMIVMFFIAGLFSYGMQFELERGQDNVLAFLFSMSAIYIYHYHHSFRRYAYVLFSIAVQLKLYPAIFVVMLVKDWRDWKGNLRRAVLLGLFNFALLFIGGIGVFGEFINSVLTQMKNPGWSWTGNHSIKAFLSEFIENKGFGLVNADTLIAIKENSALISSAFLVIFILAFLSALLLAYRRNEGNFDAMLFLVCMIGALIIPISNDYTLSILAAPVAMAFTAIIHNHYGRSKFAAIFLVLIASVSYSTALYPFKYKAAYLQNLFPALFILLIAVTLLNLIMTAATNERAD